MPDSGSSTVTAAEAIREATDRALARWPESFLIGEGVADPKGIFGTTSGLVQKYGPDRVVEMPVAENGLTGIVIGAAMVGQRPILVHQRVDFALLSLEQLFNNAAKTHYVTNGRHKVPMVVRMVVGRGWGQGPAHSQSLEAVFAHVPGLKVVMPSLPGSFHTLMLDSVADDNPVLMIEHRWLHYVTGPVGDADMGWSLKEPCRLREGGDVTIVATSYMVLEALRAAERLAEAGVEAEIIDLSVLRPLNPEIILESVRKTGRLVVCDTGWSTFGVGAEILSVVVERAFGALKAAPKRIGLPDHPTPSSASLAATYYPGSADIADAVASMTGMSEAAVISVRDRLAEERASLPIDKPDPAFKGPF